MLRLLLCCDSRPEQFFRARGGECDMFVSVVLFVFKPILENWVGICRGVRWRSPCRPVLSKLVLSSSGCLKSGSPHDNKDFEFKFAGLPAMYP